MPSSYTVLFAGQPADPTFYAEIVTVEVEENADLPGAVQITVPVNRTSSSDLTGVTDGRYDPLTNIAVTAQADGQNPECIFDGYVLENKLHLDKGTTESKLEVWGQDASWLMNLEEKTKEWPDLTDGDVANKIFGDYGISPDSGNTSDDSPSHVEAGHTLMQRDSDIQFLRMLAGRNGKLCRVVCKNQPGQRTGIFAKPKLDGQPKVTLVMNDPSQWTVESLDFEWNVTRPTAVSARVALLNDSDPDGASGGTSDSGLDALGARRLADFAGKPMVVTLTATVDDAGELLLRSQSLLRDAGWFVRCRGETDVARLKSVLRVGDIVQIDNVGTLNSGKYYVWNVRHIINRDTHKMHFILVRNAVGAAPANPTSSGDVD